MDRHGTKRGLSHTLIEIRQELIATEAGVAAWAEWQAAFAASQKKKG
jgi:predicted N-formylglutamate amidohydrolase